MERCPDDSCGYENRIEYCEEQVTHPDGAAGMIVDLLDVLLYENEHIESDQYTLHAAHNGTELKRAFSFLHADFDTWIWPLTETKIAIQHTTDNRTGMNSYEVEVVWQVRHDREGTDETNTVTYSIDQPTNGYIHGAIEQKDLTDGMYKEALMTTYDYEQLFDIVALVDKSQSAERDDNARAAAA